MSTLNPVETTCPTCAASILLAVWDDQEGMPPIGSGRIDPTPLSDPELIACILTRRRTWQLHDSILGPITRRHTTSWPARRDLPGVILPTHRCGRTFTDLDRITLDVVRPPIPDTCPF